jgi:hypothetical protein
MKKVLVLAAVSEAATGLVLLTAPALVGRLLLGVELAGAAIPVARIAGIALIALGVGCWPGSALAGMLTYSILVTVYLACVGIAALFAGVLLWPAVGVHAVLTVLLARVAFAQRQAKVAGIDAANREMTLDNPLGKKTA